MDKEHQQALMVAAAFAHTFLVAVDHEMMGASPERTEQARLQLIAALNGIEYKEEAQ